MGERTFIGCYSPSTNHYPRLRLDHHSTGLTHCHVWRKAKSAGISRIASEAKVYNDAAVPTLLSSDQKTKQGVRTERLWYRCLNASAPDACFMRVQFVARVFSKVALQVGRCPPQE